MFSFFDWGAIYQYLLIAGLVGAAVVIILLGLPFIAISFGSACFCGLGVAVLVFLACLLGFGGGGIGGGKGEGKGIGHIREKTTKSQKNELLITIDRNEFVINGKSIEFEKVDALLKKKINEGGLEKVVFYYKKDYRAKASEQSKKLAQKYSDKVPFDRIYQE